jgi:G protein beta subunit-like protein
MLATTSGDQTAKIWTTDNFTLQKTLSDPAQRWVWDVAFTSDSRYMFTGKFKRLLTTKLLCSVRLIRRSFSSKGSSDNFARLWNLETGAVQREYAGHQKAVTSIAFRDA